MVHIKSGSFHDFEAFWVDLHGVKRCRGMFGVLLYCEYDILCSHDILTYDAIWFQRTRCSFCDPTL